MSFINKRLHGQGWYKVKPIFDGVKYEVIYFDGKHLYREDVKLPSYERACEYCRNKINLA